MGGEGGERGRPGPGAGSSSTSVAPSEPAPPQGLAASSARRALRVLGDRWTLLILRDAFLGVRRFDAWQSNLGIARSTLTVRLKQLCEARILERVSYQERPLRWEYRLTQRGRELYPLALMLWRWQRRWGAGDEDAAGALPRRLRHAGCGRVLRPELRCQGCDAVLRAEEVSVLPGPGAGREAPTPARHRRRSERPSESASGAEAIAILGDRWLCEVLAAAFAGVTRFDSLQRSLGMATNILSDRLAESVRLGLQRRRRYARRPERYEYPLTAKGRDLFPVVLGLLDWGGRWCAGPRGAPERLVHRPCGAPIGVRLACAACDGTVGPGGAELLPDRLARAPSIT